MDEQLRHQVWSWADLLIGSVALGRLDDAVRRGTLLAARPRMEYLVAVELGLRTTLPRAEVVRWRANSARSGRAILQLRRLAAGIAISRGEPGRMPERVWQRAATVHGAWLQACHQQAAQDLAALWNGLQADPEMAAPFTALLLAGAAGMK